MPWTTPQQVLDQTGVTVDETACRVASAMIDTKAGTSPDMPEDSIGPRDRATLGRAAAWQAAWINDKLAAGLLTQRESARQVASAGVSTTRDSDASLLYAPMALMELRNLSWFGTRPESRLPDSVRLGPVNFLNEASDVFGTWKLVP